MLPSLNHGVGVGELIGSKGNCDSQSYQGRMSHKKIDENIFSCFT